MLNTDFRKQNFFNFATDEAHIATIIAEVNPPVTTTSRVNLLEGNPASDNFFTTFYILAQSFYIDFLFPSSIL